MLTSLRTAASVADNPVISRPAYRHFRAMVRKVYKLSPNFTRITFGGSDFAEFGTLGLDQRIKIVFPHPVSEFKSFPDGNDWYQQWRALPTEEQNQFRTYSVRAIRQQAHEIDVDFALHGEHGTASRWAMNAERGQELVILGPDDLSPERHIGIDFRPGTVERILLAGDETAAPAICAILEQLPRSATGVAIIEIGDPADALFVDAPMGISVRWLARDPHGIHGERLIPAVRDWAVRACYPVGHTYNEAFLKELHADETLTAKISTEAPLWDVPEGRSLDGELYAWLAGESSVITSLRRFLVKEAGLDRRQVAFMGYWRRGHTQDA